MEQAKRYFILSVDYELFGNGSGDVMRHMIEPGRELDDIGRRRGVPFTFFVEIEEYLAFRKYRKALTKALGYDPAALIEEQVAEWIRHGHEVQLHLHPEWYGADYRDGRWTLNRQTNTVDSLFASNQEANDYIADRKRVLEQLARVADPAYAVCAYRAGAFCAQPGELLLHALVANGICFDSSLVKGMIRSRPPTFDFRAAPRDLWHWPVSRNVSVEDPTGAVIEVPVYSCMGRRYSQLTLKRLMAKFSRQVPKDKQKELLNELGVGRNPLSVISVLFKPIPIKLDFHNLSSHSMMRMIRKAPEPLVARQVPVHVAIGHTKEHHGGRHIEQFIGLLRNSPDMSVVTFSKLRALIVGL